MVEVRITDANGDGELVEEWLMGKADATKDAYGRDVEQFMEWAGEPALEDVRVRLLKEWGEHLESKYKRSTASRKLKAVKSLFSYAYDSGYLKADPGQVVHAVPSPNKFNERILPPEKVREIIRCAEPGRDRILVLTLYGLGIRASEASALRWGDRLLYGQRVKIRNSKGGKDRVLPVPDGIWEDWERLEEMTQSTGQDDAIFQDRSGEPVTRKRVWAVVKETAEKTTIDLDRYSVSPHWLRHCHASHAIDNGAPISLVQARLGHESVDTTTIYLHAKSEPSGDYLDVLEDFYGGGGAEAETANVREAIETLVEYGATEDEVLSIVQDTLEDM